jgi:hypothetical protein
VYLSIFNSEMQATVIIPAQAAQAPPGKTPEMQATDIIPAQAAQAPPGKTPGESAYEPSCLPCRSALKSLQQRIPDNVFPVSTCPACASMIIAACISEVAAIGELPKK